MTTGHQTRSSGNGSWTPSRVDSRTAAPMHRQTHERSIGELFAELANETRTLVRDEIQLAKAELKQNTAGLGANAGKVAVGGALLYVSLFTFTATLVLLLGTFLPYWVAGLAVTLLYGIIGYTMLQGGLRGLRKVSLTPKETIRTLQEDAQWAKEQI